MATSKKFSELPAASSVGNGDLFAIAHEDAQAETGYVSQKLTAAQAGQKMNGDTEYPTSLPSFPENGQNPFAALEKLNADIEALYPVNTASGSIANFTTSLVKPLTALTSTIVAQQASGTPTPSNPLPISGVSSVSFYQCGVNLWDEVWEVGAIDADGNNAENNSRIRSKNYISVVPSKTYYIKTPKGIWIWGYNYEKTYVARIPSTAASANTTITIPPDVYYIRFVVVDAYGTTYNNDIAILYPSTQTEYVPYNPQSETKTIALGGTYYGGVLDVKNGKLVITHVCEELGSLTWGLGTGGSSRFVANPTYTAKAPTVTTIQADVISDIFKPVSSKTIYDGTDDYEIAIHTNGTIWVRDTDYSDKDAFKTAMTNHYVCYELATPVEIDITANNFTAINGEQNIFSDCGDVEVSFKQGIQEYIDAKIAETQALVL